MATATAMRWVRRLALPRRRAANPAPPLPAAGLGWPCCNFKHSRATGTLAADCSSAARPVHDVAGGGGGNAEAVAGRHIISVSLRGRPTRLQASAIERLWPRYGVGPRPSLTAVPRDRRRRRGNGEPARGVDSGDDSGDQQDVLITWPRDDAARVLEIGTGMGEGFVKLAAAWPHVDFVGVELYEPGVGALLLGAEQAQLRNARVVCRDAREVLVRQVEAGSLDAVHVLFPDPWPKKRHHKRRLLQPAFVELVASKLRVGGVLHVATDWEELAHEHHDVLEACPLLRNTAAPARVNGDATGDAGVPASAAAGTAPETTTADNTDGFVARPQWRPVTKFEARARQEGRNTWDMCYRRVQPPGGGGGSGGGDGCDGAEEPRALPVGPPPPPPPR